MAPKKYKLSIRETIITIINSILNYREISKDLNLKFSSVRPIIKRKKEITKTNKTQL